MQGELFLTLEAVGRHRFKLQHMGIQTVLDSAITISPSKNLPLITDPWPDLKELILIC